MEVDIFGPEAEMMAHLQGQVLALSAILSRPGLKKWSAEEVLEKAKSPCEAGGDMDKGFKRGLADTLDFVSSL